MGSQETGKDRGGPTPMDVLLAGKIKRPSMAVPRTEVSSDAVEQGAEHVPSSPSSSSAGVPSAGNESETSGGGTEGMEELVSRFPELARVDDLGLEEQVRIFQSALDALQKELHGQD